MKIQINILIIALLVFFSGIVNAQQNPDKNQTISYLKKFEMNKDKYIGKPFSLVLKYMFDIKPTTAKSTFNNDVKNAMTSTSLGFSDKGIDEDDQAILIIKWKADDMPTTPIEFAEEESNYRFTPHEKNLLEKKIVKDIAVVIK